MRLRLAVIALLLVTAACSGRSGVLRITDSWAPSTPPGAQVAVVYLTIENGTDVDDRLVSVSSDRCGAIELHATQFDEDRIMRMRLAEPGLLEIKSGETMEMVPGGLHVMCIDLPTPFKAGEPLVLTVTLETSGDFEITTLIENR